MTTPAQLAEALGEVIGRAPREQQPLLVALAERLAAERYRTWARDTALHAHAEALVACAEREVTIAAQVEALFDDGPTIQSAFHAENPDIDDINRNLFADLPLLEQLALQAQAERLGAATWRAFAKEHEGLPAAEVFGNCAQLEETSAEVLEAIVAEAR